jgi:hypothetical protein
VKQRVKNRKMYGRKLCLLLTLPFQPLVQSLNEKRYKVYSLYSGEKRGYLIRSGQLFSAVFSFRSIRSVILLDAGDETSIFGRNFYYLVWDGTCAENKKKSSQDSLIKYYWNVVCVYCEIFENEYSIHIIGFLS